MGIKSTLKYLSLVVFFIFFSCKKDIKKNKISSNAIIENKTDDIDSKQAKEFIKSFYLTCYKDENIRQDNNLLKNFISNRLLNRLETINTRDNVVLSYDPFIKAQDYNSDVIKQTLRINQSQNKSEFKVSFNLFELENETPTNILLYLIKNNNSYLIDAINSNKYLNLKEINKFNEEHQNIKKEEKQVKNRPQADNVNYIKEDYMGTYSYFLDMGKLDEISSLTVTYTIVVKNNDIVFYGQGYKTNFEDLCTSNINKGVLEIYYKETLDGTDYNKNKNQPLIKLYKKGTKFYAKSSVIEDGKEIELKEEF